MRNPFKRKRLDREAMVDGLSPEVAACWPPFWADCEMDDDAWMAALIAWSLGIEKWLLEVRINPDPARAQTREVIDRAIQRMRNVGTPLRQEHLDALDALVLNPPRVRWSDVDRLGPTT